MARDIFIPKLGMTMEEATIAEWRAKDGDHVQPGDVILVIDTEKVAHEMEAPCEGILIILAAPGEVHRCGAVVGRLAETKAEYEALHIGASQAGGLVEAKSVLEPDLSTPVDVAETQLASKSEGRIFISPVAWRMAEINQIDISRMSGSGPRGRIVKMDVEKFLAEKPSVAPHQEVDKLLAAPTKDEVDGKRIKKIIPLKGIRKAVALNMLNSHLTAARLTGIHEFDVTEFIAFRKYFAGKADSIGLRVTYTDLLILIVAKALKAVPLVNSSLVKDEIRVWEDINVGFAVAMGDPLWDAGLVVPVIKNADRKGLVEISHDRKTLMDKAREGKLTQDDVSGGTFTITNPGTLLPAGGWFIQTPIINQPETAILGMSPIVEKPVAINGQIVIRPIMPLCFSYDHRVLVGAPASVFMSKVNEFLQDPKMLLA